MIDLKKISANFSLIELLKSVITYLNYKVKIIPIKQDTDNMLFYNNEIKAIECFDCDISFYYNKMSNHSNYKEFSHYKAIMNLIEEKLINFELIYSDDMQLYTLFCLLHEIGHYHDDINNHSFFKLQSTRYTIELEQLNKNAENEKNYGLNQIEIYDEFALNYRNIPLEASADQFAIDKIKRILQMNDINRNINC